MKQTPAGITQETDPTVSEWAKEPTKPTYTADEVGALPVSTKIPVKTSELTNDSGYLTQIPEEYVTETELAQKGYVTEEDIPEKLPSPGILTFTGAVNDTYDGSTDKIINIPTGGGGGTPGKDGREIEIQNNGTAIQWRYKGEEDWVDLVQLSEITGKTPNIKIGEVTTLEPGTPATATMTGTPENPLLNLGIPKGERGGGFGYDEDNQENYVFSTKIKNGNLMGVLQYEEDSPTGTGLDSVAINGKTYREIFVDGNKIQWGDFESGSEEFVIQSGTPVLSEEECVSKKHSLKAFGEISQQYKIGNAYTHTNSTSVYIALKAKCDRYVNGTLGFNNGFVTVGASGETSGFETFSTIDTFSGVKSCFIGSILSANLDGYVDDIVVVNITEVFGDDIPEKEDLDEAYNNYISIITSNSSSNMSYNMISDASAKRTEEYILSSDKHIEHTDSECIDAFMTLVNKKAKYYGMLNSNFTSPSGAGGNTSCAKDLAIAGYYACGYRDILDVWKHKQYKVKVCGPNSRDISISSTVMNTPIGDHTVYGGKTGSWAGTENLLVIADVNNEVFVCVVMDCGSSQDRFIAMKELLDVISSSSGEVSTATAACAYKIPTQIPQLHTISEEIAIYTKNEMQEIIPASVTKVMTAMTAIDYADGLSEKILFKPSDLESGSGAVFQAGDIITLKDALEAMMLPSSNMAAKSIARNIGKKYLERIGN